MLIGNTSHFGSRAGDLERHLSFMGYKLSYTQSPIMEFDFGVANLAVDLRDGIRLCKLVEVRPSGSALRFAASPAFGSGLSSACSVPEPCEPRSNTQAFVAKVGQNTNT
eukprot:1175673-Prorocentrum_minimum.AAC.3